MTRLFNKPMFNKNNGSKSTSNKNNDNKPTFKKNDDNNMVDRFDINRNNIKHAKKLEKSKSEKMSKS